MITQELGQIYKNEKDANVRERILMVIWLKENKTTYEVAELIGCYQSKVMYWKKRFEREGVDGLKTRQKPGKPKEISEEDEIRIKHKLSENTFGWNTKSVIELIKEESSIEYTRRHVNRLMNKWGFRRIRPRKKHIAADEKEQKAFKKS